MVTVSHTYQSAGINSQACQFAGGSIGEVPRSLPYKQPGINPRQCGAGGVRDLSDGVYAGV